MKREGKRSLVVETGNRKNCHFISESIDGCYCNSTSSTKIEEAIYYCGKHYKECRIYLAMISAKRNQSNDSHIRA